LPYSHVGDERFEKRAITYDSAVVSLAYIASGKAEEAKRIIGFCISTPSVWRIGGIIEAVDSELAVLGADWSVRTGANMWMGIAGVHLYKTAQGKRYLKFSKRIANFALSLQNKDKDSVNYGCIRLGPKGEGNVTGPAYCL